MPRKRTIIILTGLLLLALATATCLSIQASDMFKACLFSPVKGKVIYKGQPVVGAVIERSYDWAWKNQQGKDETVTDQNGEFSLPAIYGTMVLGSVLPHEPSINQEILIKHKGRPYGAWYNFKREYEEFGELRGVLEGHPINLLCDLEKQVTNHGDHGGIGELQVSLKQP